MTPEEQITTIRNMHVVNNWQDCEGCYDTTWPCSTAEVVYSPDEIKVIEDKIKVDEIKAIEANNIKREQRKKEILAGSPLTMSERITQVYLPLINEQLLKGPIYFEK